MGVTIIIIIFCGDEDQKCTYLVPYIDKADDFETGDHINRSPVSEIVQNGDHIM